MYGVYGVCGVVVTNFSHYFCTKISLFTPFKSFLFLLACLLILGSIGYFVQTNTIQITDKFSLKIFDTKKLFQKNDTDKKDTVEKIIQQTNLIEKEIDKDSVPIYSIDTLKVWKAIQPLKIDENFVSLIEYPNGDKSVMQYFFSALQNVTQKSTHILYYGDSQIEEDRFSGFFREKLQSHYGGSGCGLLSFMPIAQWIYPKIIYSDNWTKWSCFASTPSKNEQYGPMGQTFIFDSSKGKGRIQIKCNASASSHHCSFNKIKLFYGHANEPVLLHYYNQSNKKLTDTLKDGNDFVVKEYAVENTNDIVLEFEGLESPYFYGLSLESFGNGIYVDNIALRGSSGTFFHYIPKKILQEFFEIQNVCLVILQFGGNVMPIIDNIEKAKQYANYISSQIKILKSIKPKLSIMLVGPSDMSVNIEGEMVTHPFLEDVNQELKKISLQNGCAYFDMYRAMGGKNSMPIWVKENLAANDYIHFSPAGARKMATLIYYSLMSDFVSYTKNKTKDIP